jgi:hypothetical protein
MRYPSAADVDVAAGVAEVEQERANRFLTRPSTTTARHARGCSCHGRTHPGAKVRSLNVNGPTVERRSEAVPAAIAIADIATG